MEAVDDGRRGRGSSRSRGRRLLQEGRRPGVLAAEHGPPVVHAGHDHGGGGLGRGRRCGRRGLGERPVVRRRLATAAVAVAAVTAVATTVVRFDLERPGVQVRRLHRRRSFVELMVVRRPMVEKVLLLLRRWLLLLLLLLRLLVVPRFWFLHDHSVVLVRRGRGRRRLFGLGYWHGSDSAARLFEFRIVSNGQVRRLRSRRPGWHFGLWSL